MSTNADPLFARVLRVAGPVALALAVLVVVALRGGGDAAQGDVEPLPEYGVAAVAGDAGAPASSPSARLRVGAERFEILVRPATVTAGRVAAWPFTFTEGGEPTPLQADVDVSPQGVVRIRGKGPALDGVREVRVVLAPAGSAKFDVAAERARTGESDARLRVLKVAIER